VEFDESGTGAKTSTGNGISSSHHRYPNQDKNKQNENSPMSQQYLLALYGFLRSPSRQARKRASRWISRESSGNPEGFTKCIFVLPGSRLRGNDGRCVVNYGKLN